MLWVAFAVAGLFVLVMCYVPSTDWLDTRYAYFVVAMTFIVVAEVMAPLVWKITLVIPVMVIIYFAERYYARMWARPRLWWYRFLQHDK